jgi:hypothetical protein
MHGVTRSYARSNTEFKIKKHFVIEIDYLEIFEINVIFIRSR